MVKIYREKGSEGNFVMKDFLDLIANILFNKKQMFKNKLTNRSHEKECRIIKENTYTTKRTHYKRTIIPEFNTGLQQHSNSTLRCETCIYYDLHKFTCHQTGDHALSNHPACNLYDDQYT
jgi:hypothetical protein